MNLHKYRRHGKYTFDTRMYEIPIRLYSSLMPPNYNNSKRSEKMEQPKEPKQPIWFRVAKIVLNTIKKILNVQEKKTDNISNPNK